MDIKATLTKRVGPLPMWGWGAVAVGSIGVFLIMRKRGGAATGTQQDALGFGSSTGGGAGGGGAGGGGNTSTGGSGGAPSGGGGSSPADVLPHDAGPSNFSASASAPDAIDTGWQPNAIAPISNAEEALVRAGHATPDIAAKIIANNLAGTIDFAAKQVGQSEQAVRITGATMGATAAQMNEQQQAVADALVAKGYTASVVNGQVLAAKSSGAYWNALNPTQQQNLARWLVATQPRAA